MSQPTAQDHGHSHGEPTCRAAFYADSASVVTETVIENVRIARDTYRIRVRCPEIAKTICPGQFVMLRLADGDDPLLARPFALYDVVRDTQGQPEAGQPEAIDIVYLVLGKMTSRLCQIRPGTDVTIWGPLGNGFLPCRGERLVMVAGGIGQTPFLALAKEAAQLAQYGDPTRKASAPIEQVLCYGARSADWLAGLDDFEAAHLRVLTSTDDGSAGHHGRVTDLLKQVIDESEPDKRASTRVVCCGPEPMMEAVAEICREHTIRCEVSLETPMACGIGICFSCVTPIWLADGSWDYKRTCVDGPVFDAAKICWDPPAT